MTGSIYSSLRAIAIKPPWIRFVPGSSKHFGPPRHCLSTNEYVARYGEQIALAPSEVETLYPPATVLGDEFIRIDNRAESRIPRSSVFTIRNARLLGPDGWIVGERDTFLYDSSFWSFSTRPKRSQHPIYKRKKSPSVRILQGHTLSLASEFCCGSLGHLVSESLIRLYLFLLVGRTLDEIDWIYLPRPSGFNIDYIVSKLGFPREKILNWNSQQDVFCEKLTATSFPGLPGNPPGDGIRFLQARLAPKIPAAGSQLLYISRQTSRRRLANAEQIESILRSYNFAFSSPETDADLITKCAAANCIVALDGSNFTNVIFCAPGANILLIATAELASPPYSFTLAGHCQHHLFLLKGKQVPLESEVTGVWVDPHRFEQALLTIFSSGMSNEPTRNPL